MGSTFVRKKPSLENKYIKSLTHVYPLVKELFINIPEYMSYPEWITHCLAKLKKLTSNKSIPNMVKGLELKFYQNQCRTKREKNASKQEIQELLRKGVITRTNPCKNEFASNFFLR